MVFAVPIIWQMAKKRIHILSAVNAANISKAGAVYTIRDVCGALDGIVMNGMLYPADQLAAGVPTLEDKPAPAGHPRNSAGHYISATNGEALQSAYIGSICKNARHTAGRTLADVVVNEAQAKATPAGASLIERLDAAIAGTNSAPIHVSTGLFCDEVHASGESMGKKYNRIATNIRYDHLAILLNEAGAGTPEQGVGMFLNHAGQPEEVETANLLMNTEDAEKAEKSLRAAIDLHQAHMDGKEPVTGPDGDKSQMKMMKMMRAALSALVGKQPAKGDGMAMNSVDRRHDGLTGWIHKLLGNSDMSFDQISEGLRALLPEDAWPREVFARYFVWADYKTDKLYRQDYAISSDGVSVTLTSDPIEVTRKVEYEPITNSQKDDDTVKPKILAALNAAGIQTDGLDDGQLLNAYNSLITKPHTDALTTANSKIAGFEMAAAAAADAELTTLATSLSVNSSLTVADLKNLGLPRLKELAAAGKAAPVVVGNAGAKPADEFAGYDINTHEGA